MSKIKVHRSVLYLITMWYYLIITDNKKMACCYLATPGCKGTNILQIRFFQGLSKQLFLSYFCGNIPGTINFILFHISSYKNSIKTVQNITKFDSIRYDFVRIRVIKWLTKLLASDFCQIRHSFWSSSTLRIYERFFNPIIDEIIPNTIEFCYILSNFDAIFIDLDMNRYKIDYLWHIPTKIWQI